MSEITAPVSLPVPRATTLPAESRCPAFDAAAPPEQARALYESVVRELRAAQLPVATGEFQAMMRVELVNDGPVTILIDSKRQF